jgi:hypothetical protein
MITNSTCNYSPRQEIRGTRRGAEIETAVLHPGRFKVSKLGTHVNLHIYIVWAVHILHVGER